MPTTAKTQTVERQKHPVMLRGELFEIAAIVTRTRRDWDALPESRREEWSAQQTADGGVLALRLFG